MSEVRPRLPSSRRRPRRAGAVRGLAAGLLAISITAPAAPALADAGDTCVSGFERGQEAKKQGLRLKARAELRSCAGACPEVLAAECRKWLAEVEGEIGRVRVTVEDAAGRPVESAAIRVDGEGVAGREVEVDPGAHALSIEAAGYGPVQRNIEVGQGATVPVSVVLSPVPPPPPPPAGARKPVAIGLAAAGGLSLVAGGALLVFGKVEEGRLAGTCRPACTPESVAVVERVWIGGGVAVGAGALLGAAALLLWPPATPVKAAVSAWQVWVDPSGGGGILGTGVF